MKKAIRQCILASSLLILVGSCNSNISDPVKYAQAISESKDLNKKVTIGKLEYDFKILTPEIIALQSSTDENHTVNKQKYEERLKDLKGHVFLNIDMQLSDHSNNVLKYNLNQSSDYEQRVMYYEFYAKNDLKIVCDGKEILPKSYEYENHEGLSPTNTIVAVFPADEQAEHLQVVFNDRAFNNLFVKADFKQSDINNLPKLTIK